MIIVKLFQNVTITVRLQDEQPGKIGINHYKIAIRREQKRFELDFYEANRGGENTRDFVFRVLRFIYLIFNRDLKLATKYLDKSDSVETALEKLQAIAEQTKALKNIFSHGEMKQLNPSNEELKRFVEALAFERIKTRESSENKEGHLDLFTG
jgi:hypothetical protein